MSSPSPRTTRAEIEAHYAALIPAERLLAEVRRDSEWVGGPRELAGIAIHPFNLGHLLTLRAARNAFFVEEPAPEDPAEQIVFWQSHCAQFLWTLAVDYRPGREALAEFLLHKIRPQPVEGLVALLADYIREVFADRPEPVKFEDDESAPEHGSVAASFGACWIHEFATAYGWPPAVVLAMPLGQIFQLRQILRLEAMIKAGKTPPPATDRAAVLAAQAFAEIAALQP